MFINKLLRPITCFIAISGLFACNQAPKKSATIKIDTSIKQDSFITTPCALLIYPTIHQIDSMKSKGDSTDFNTTADDYQYYMGTSINYLDSLNTKIITKESKGSIAFKLSENKVYHMQLDNIYWGIILFNGKSKPIKADITMIDDDYKKYMRK